MEDTLKTKTPATSKRTAHLEEAAASVQEVKPTESTSRSSWDLQASLVPAYSLPQGVGGGSTLIMTGDTRALTIYSRLRNN